LATEVPPNFITRTGMVCPWSQARPRVIACCVTRNIYRIGDCA